VPKAPQERYCRREQALTQFHLLDDGSLVAPSVSVLQGLRTRRWTCLC